MNKFIHQKFQTIAKNQDDHVISTRLKVNSDKKHPKTQQSDRSSISSLFEKKIIQTEMKIENTTLIFTKTLNELKWINKTRTSEDCR